MSESTSVSVQCTGIGRCQVTSRPGVFLTWPVCGCEYAGVCYSLGEFFKETRFYAVLKIWV